MGGYNFWNIFVVLVEMVLTRFHSPQSRHFLMHTMSVFNVLEEIVKRGIFGQIKAIVCQNNLLAEKGYKIF